MQGILLAIMIETLSGISKIATVAGPKGLSEKGYQMYLINCGKNNDRKEWAKRLNLIG